MQVIEKQSIETVHHFSKAGYFASSHKQTFYSNIFLLHFLACITVPTKRGTGIS